MPWQASTAKGATCFAWSSARGEVAASVRRRVLLFQLRARERYGTTAAVELEQLLDVAAPDAALCMLWAGAGLTPRRSVVCAC